MNRRFRYDNARDEIAHDINKKPTEITYFAHISEASSHCSGIVIECEYPKAVNHAKQDSKDQNGFPGFLSPTLYNRTYL